MKHSFTTLAYKAGHIHVCYNPETHREEITAQFRGERIACASLPSAKRAVSNMERIEQLHISPASRVISHTTEPSNIATL